jgi:hypothetical protein
MRTLVYTLALSTAAFAGSTVYYAHQLSLERERSAAQSRAVSAASTVSTPSSSPAGHSATDAARKPEATPDTPGRTAAVVAEGQWQMGRPMSEDDMKRAQQEFSRRFLAQVADPQQREELVAERRMMMRHSFPRVDLVVGLTPEEHARFIELNALQQIEMQEATSRCTLDPACQMRDLYSRGQDSRSQDIADLLGPERAHKFEIYKNTMSEREAISQLRMRLPDAQRLSDDKAESLIAALAEEREAQHRDAAQRGVGMNGFGFGAGMVFSPNDGGTVEERYEAARQGSLRLRERAAQHLTPEQQRLFNEMQEETLLGLRAALRNKNNMSFQAVTVAQ